MLESDVYGGQDPREMPAYSIPEAAHYLQMPSSTLRGWVKGWTYRTEAGERFSSPLLVLPEPPERGPLLLSFVNVGSHLRRDNLVSVLYAEELSSTKSSVFLQRTDRHGILGQKSADFQCFLSQRQTEHPPSKDPRSKLRGFQEWSSNKRNCTF